VLKEEWTTAIRVGGRRWDLKLRNGLKVYLPIEEIDKSLQELEKLCQEKNVLKKEIVSVDLRVVDRVILGLSTPGIIQTRFHTTKAKKV
jgi:cell division protein FtsQ